MQANDRLSEAFVVANEPPEARLPGERSLGDPTTGQEDEAVFGVGKLDHMEFNALGRRLGGALVGVALVDVDQLDMFAGGVQDGLGEGLDLSPILLVGWGDNQRQELAQGVDGQMELAALLPFVAVVARAVAALGRALHGLAVEPNNADAHYNLGMALSDLGEFDTAQLHLLKVIHLDPDNVNALVALGVALYRAGDPSAARRRLEQALALDPENGFAHRNLAAVLAGINESAATLEHFRAAHRLLPDDPASAYGLAQALEQMGNDDDRTEADQLYKATIALNPHSELAERARQSRSRIAQTSVRTASPGIRMDAVMYCLGALERFEGMSRDEIQAIGFEIAMLGRRGLDVNSPDSRYTLRTLPGEFSGLHLVSLMYTAFKQIAPETDVGFDLSREYEAAISMHNAQKHST